jgi:hypothetical protein
LLWIFHFLNIATHCLISEGKEEFDVTGRTTYIQACRESGVIPASYFLRNMQQPIIDIKHHGLGAMGTKAIAIALVVSKYLLLFLLLFYIIYCLFILIYWTLFII